MTKQLELIPAFELFITESIQGKRRLHSGQKISSGTIDQYQVVLLYLREFEVKYKVTLRCTIGASKSERKYKAERNYWIKFRRKLESFLQQEHKCYDAYIAAVFKTIRTFLNYLRGEKGLGLPVFNKVFNFPSYTYQPIILDNTQLRSLANNQLLQQQLTPRQKRSLDMFLVGCILGLRFSDLVKLKAGNTRRFEGQYFVELTTQKTGNTVVIPLPAFAQEIMLRQGKHKNQLIFWPISLSNFNLHLKQIMELAGFTDYAPKFRHRKGKLIEIKTSSGKSYRVCDHFSSHSMRRIAITSLLTMGVSEQVVRKLSGHAAGSKDFYRYVILAQDYTNREIAQAQEKLFGTRKDPESL